MPELETAAADSPRLEFLVPALLAVFHAVLLTQALRVDVIYLGGDSAFRAWGAAKLLGTGRFVLSGDSPYMSGAYVALLAPFVLLFGRTLLCLKVAAAAVSLATVLVFYWFARRRFGLLAAAVLGLLCAASPQLLANCASNAEAAVPLWVSTILLLGTFPGRKWRLREMLAAGFFTSLHAFFLIPFLGYAAATAVWKGPRRPSLDHLLAFALGSLPWALKLTVPAQGQRGPVATAWLVGFLRWNLARWLHPLILAQGAWRQFTWSLGSLLVHGSAPGPLPAGGVVWLWLLALGVSLFFPKARRWPLTLAACLAAACLFASPDGGLAMRHLTALIPFHWLMLGPVVASLRSRPARRALLGLLLCAGIAGGGAAFALAADRSGEESVAANTEALERLIAQDPRDRVTVVSGDWNLYYDLRFLTPDRPIDFVEVPALSAARAGKIILSREHAQIPPARPREVARYLLSGRTTYDVLREKNG